jgi:hypothetical protein
MQPANRLDHPRHDQLLIAGHAAGDLTGAELAAAERLLGTCERCTDLHADLIALSAASRALPAPATADRDFRIDAGQAERLQRGSWLRRVLRPFADARWSARPLAATFTSVGVAGLLVASFAPNLLGSAASGPTLDLGGPGAGRASGGPIAVTASEGAAEPDAPAPGASGGELGVDQLATAAPEVDASDEKNAPRSTDGTLSAYGGGAGSAEQDGRQNALAPTRPNPIVIGSIAFLAVGLGLFILRLAGRRLRA